MFFLVLITLVLVVSHAASPAAPPLPVDDYKKTFKLIAVWIASPNVTIPANSQVEPILVQLKAQGATMALSPEVADYSNDTVSKYRDLTGDGNAMGKPNLILAVDAHTTIVGGARAVGTGVGASSSILLGFLLPVTLT